MGSASQISPIFSPSADQAAQYSFRIQAFLDQETELPQND